MGSRGEILSRIRKGLRGAGPPDGSALRTSLSLEALGARWREAEAAREAKRDDLVEAFMTECGALSVQVHPADSGETAGDILAGVIRDREIERVIQWRTPLLERLNVSTLVEKAGATEVPAAAGGSDSGPAGAAFTAAAGAQLGITEADYGLADTGTLVIRHGRDQDRSTSLLPPVHVAFLETGRILAGLDPLLDRLQLDLREKRDPDRCVTLISGPSKTADIGINLVLGIHGPREVHVILLDSPG